jgi:hypothetical protein
MSWTIGEGLGTCAICERAPATVERCTTNLKAAFCAECDRDLHGAHVRKMERRAWTEGSWTEAGEPVLPGHLPDFVWLWIEGKPWLDPDRGLDAMSSRSMTIMLRTVRYYFRERENRNPRWFWRAITPVEPPKFP